MGAFTLYLTENYADKIQVGTEWMARGLDYSKKEYDGDWILRKFLECYDDAVNQQVPAANLTVYSNWYFFAERTRLRESEAARIQKNLDMNEWAKTPSVAATRYRSELARSLDYRLAHCIRRLQEIGGRPPKRITGAIDNGVKIEAMQAPLQFSVWVVFQQTGEHGTYSAVQIGPETTVKFGSGSKHAEDLWFEDGRNPADLDRQVRTTIGAGTFRAIELLDKDAPCGTDRNDCCGKYIVPLRKHFDTILHEHDIPITLYTFSDGENAGKRMCYYLDDQGNFVKHHTPWDKYYA